MEENETIDQQTLSFLTTVAKQQLKHEKTRLQTCYSISA